MLDQIRDAFVTNGWFQSPGAYVLVDGAYGSTGKGALAALIAAVLGDQIDVVTTNAGPNSGHTAFRAVPPTVADEKLLVTGAIDYHSKIVTRQIPIAGCTLLYQPGFNRVPLIYLNGGAIIDPAILKQEANENFVARDRLFVHPCAAIIDDDHRAEPDSIRAIASTNKGVGLALARKVLRETNVAKFRRELLNEFCDVREFKWDWSKHRVFVETAQGFSLGINQSFYPYTTSRNCTVMQAIADAEIPYNKVKKVVMSVRTFPIRVGNTAEGQSGGCYPDQEETTWEALGVEPEYTTVTKRVRRVFTWSRQQFRDAVAANQPTSIFVTFMDYLSTHDQSALLHTIKADYHGVMGCLPDFILTAKGPRPEDAVVYND